MNYRDFTTMVTYYMWSPIIVASTRTNRPFKTIQEVISYAKLHPEKYHWQPLLSDRANGLLQWHLRKLRGSI